RFMPRKTRKLTLTIKHGIRIGVDDESDAFGLDIDATFNETVQSATGFGTTLSLSYQTYRESMREGGKTIPSPIPAGIRKNLRFLHARVAPAAAANIKKNGVYNQARLKQVGDGKELLEFHEPIKEALDTAFVPLPNKQTEALTTWKTTRTLRLPGAAKGQTKLLRL